MRKTFRDYPRDRVCEFHHASYRKKQRLLEMPPEYARVVEDLCKALMVTRGFAMVWGTDETVGFINRTIEPFIEQSDAQRERSLALGAKRKEKRNAANEFANTGER